MPYLLFVDDDSNVLNIDRNYFEPRGFSISVTQTTNQTLNHAKEHPADCVVLGITMPSFDGSLLYRHFRTQMTASVIFFISLTEKEYLYQGFFLGGGDFLTRPWDLKGLEMRVQTRIGQCSNRSPKGERLEFPPLTIDADIRQASIGNICVPLTVYELDISLLLARSPGHVFSPGSIYRETQKLPDPDNIQTAKMHMAYMRHKMEAACPGHSFIGTMWRQGYRFLPENN